MSGKNMAEDEFTISEFKEGKTVPVQKEENKVI